MLEVEPNVVSIPNNVIIPCPKHDFKLARAANHCQECEHFRGLGIMSEERHLAWSDQYAIRCGHIIERRAKMEEEVV